LDAVNTATAACRNVHQATVLPRTVRRRARTSSDPLFHPLFFREWARIPKLRNNGHVDRVQFGTLCLRRQNRTPNCHSAARIDADSDLVAAIVRSSSAS
jgi:hypothetical protein